MAEPTAPQPSSIRRYAPLTRDELEKLEIDLERWPYIVKLVAKRKTDLIRGVQERAKRKYLETPSYSTVERVLEFCAEAGEKIGFVVNGVIRRIQENGESFVRFPDPFGIDPPFLERVFHCPGCGKEFTADDMIVYESYYCDQCLTWFFYDGFEVWETVPSSGYAIIGGRITSIDGPLPNVSVAIKGKIAVTDEGGYFWLEHIPPGSYELQISDNNHKTSVRIEVKDGWSIHLMIVKCEECGSWLRLDAESKGTCPTCKTHYYYDIYRLYRLKGDEAFVYDFSKNWAWWWKLKCPSCGHDVNLLFSEGVWYCPHCNSYVKPKHSYPTFRCVLLCGHEVACDIARLIEGATIHCDGCGGEYRLPENIRSAWSSFERKSPWAPLAFLVGSGLMGGLLVAICRRKR